MEKPNICDERNEKTFFVAQSRIEIAKTIFYIKRKYIDKKYLGIS